MPRVLPIAEGVQTAESVETSGEAARIPFVPKISSEPQPGVAAREGLADKSPETAAGTGKSSPPIPATPLVHDVAVEATS